MKKYIKILWLFAILQIAFTSNLFSQPTSYCTTNNHVPHSTGNMNGAMLCGQLQDDGTFVGVGMAPSAYMLNVNGDINYASGSAFYYGGNKILFSNAASNIYLGIGAAAGPPSGTDNTFVGNSTGHSTAAHSDNTFVGSTAGYSSNADANTFIGYQAGYSSANGGSTCIGSEAGKTNASGYYNCYLGYLSGTDGSATTSGIENVILGTFAGELRTSGDGNTISGFEAGRGSSSSGDNNCIYGNVSGYKITSGASNVFDGYEAGYSDTTGALNVCIGAGAGLNNNNGSNNTYIGGSSGFSTSADLSNCTLLGYNTSMSNGLSNCTVIGENAAGTTSNTILLGKVSSGPNVGIGVAAPSAQLHTTGSVRFQGLTTGTATNTVVSDGAGYLYYQSGLPATASCTTANFVPYWSSGQLACTLMGQRDAISSCISGTHSTMGVNYSPISSIPGTYNDGTCHDLTFAINGYGLCNQSWFVTSDKRLKENISSINNSLSIISSLNPVSYNYKSDNEFNLNVDNSKTYGFIAQEVEKVIPELVITTDKGYKAMNYEGIIPFLTQAIKEQQTQIEEKDSKINDLQNKYNDLANQIKDIESTLNQCCENMGSRNANVGSTQTDAATLEQNNPNPFTESSVIRFYIPTSVISATLKIFTTDGKELKSYTIDQRGNGQIEISGNSLAAGSYIYNLVTDGKQVSGKKLTLTK